MPLRRACWANCWMPRRPALGVPGESGVVRSVKAEAEALLGPLPAAGREQYERFRRGGTRETEAGQRSR